MNTNWSKLLIGELKHSLKERGFTYKEVSKALNMSESGFKKLINADDCGLNKIEKICFFIGIQMTDLFKSIEKNKLKEVSFTSKQEHLFETNSKAFLLYWFLVYERRPLDTVAKLLKLELPKIMALLRTLDSLNLLKLMQNDRLILPQPQGIKWARKTKFVKALYLKWGSELLIKAIAETESTDPDKYFMIRYLQMSESTWKEFKLQLENLELQYTNTAAREMRMNIKDLKHVRWLTAVDQESWALDEIKKMSK